MRHCMDDMALTQQCMALRPRLVPNWHLLEHNNEWNPLMSRETMTMLAALLSLTAASAAQAQQNLPEAIAAPGQKAFLMTHAVGAQIYDCKADASGKLVWTFREPVASLLVDGKTIGQHYYGPSWELADGGAIVGKVAGRAPGATATDIPWLKLEVASRRGNGQLTPATTIQRINTKGGVASGACETAGALLSVPYSTDYVFLK